MSPVVALADAVVDGLFRSPKKLPAFLFYDAEGSRLFEAITELPEYYLTRAERSIFEQQSVAISQALLREIGSLHTVVELGAGTSTKTEVLLKALGELHPEAHFVAADVSATALDEGAKRLRSSVPNLAPETFVGSHRQALVNMATRPAPRLALFIGSSIGNYEADDAVSLLRCVREGVGVGGGLLLGTDLKKDPAVLVAAYDDSAGVTAEFNKNLLARINRELAADFDMDKFHHEARYNQELSRIEMHLVSHEAQQVSLGSAGRVVSFLAGESIHTESSHKYDEAIVGKLLEESGFELRQTFLDADAQFALHLAKAR